MPAPRLRSSWSARTHRPDEACSPRSSPTCTLGWSRNPTRAPTHCFQQLRQRGYRGSLRTLREYLAQIRRQLPKAPPPPPVPSARQITAWIMRPDDKLDETDQLGLKSACVACPELAALTDPAHGFNELVRTCGGARLEEWINQATDSPFPELRGFAKGLYGDFDAVKAGLTLRWNSGKVEGNVTRVKMIKRQMYGRAKLDLLRKRILASP